MQEIIAQHIVPIAVIVFIGLVLFGGFLLPCFVARYAPQVRALILSFVGIFYTPIHTAAQWLRGCITTGRNWLRNQIAGLSPDGTTDNAVSYALGAILYAVFGCFITACEIPLGAMTLEAWGFNGISERFAALIIMDAGICIAAAVIMSAVVWGALLADALGITHFAPFIHKLKRKGQKAMIAFCSVGLLISACGLWGMAYYRGDIVSGSIMDVLVPPASAVMIDKPSEGGEVGADPVEKSADFKTLSENEATNGSMAIAEPGAEPSEETPLPHISPFSASLPRLVFTATSVNMAALSAVSLTAGSALFLWLVFAFFALSLLPACLGFGVFHAVDLVLDRIAESLMRILELMIEYGSSLLRRMGIEPGGSVSALSSGETAQSSANPAAPVSGEQEMPNPSQNVDQQATSPHSTTGFDPFGGP